LIKENENELSSTRVGKLKIIKMTDKSGKGKSFAHDKLPEGYTGEQVIEPLHQKYGQRV
jgi:hypothetical protein